MKYLVLIILKSFVYIIIMPFIVIKEMWNFKFILTKEISRAYNGSLYRNWAMIKRNLKSNMK